MDFQLAFRFMEALLFKNFHENFFKLFLEKVALKIALRVDVVISNVWDEKHIAGHLVEKLMFFL